MKNSFKIPRIFLKIFLGLIILVVVGVIVFVGLQISGKRRLYEKTGDKRPDLASVAINWQEGEETVESGEQKTNQSIPVVVEEDNSNWEEGDVRYKGIHYRYNREMLTFLFLGVDKQGTVKEAKNGIDGGQSDTIFLLALNPKAKTASLISINRDTIADVDIYDKAGNFLYTAKKMITLQHGYGDGKELSCERSVKAVSKLFYNLPIHGYCAINYGAVTKINDAVGGIDLVALEDVYSGKKLVFEEGKNYHLKGDNTLVYLRSRDCGSFESAGRRTERQKQYIAAYAAKALQAIKKDVTVLVSLYNTISKYMVTDITVDEVSYFSTQAGNYRFGDANIYSLEGETIVNDEGFEEFHANEKALFELLLNVFYDTIDD